MQSIGMARGKNRAATVSAGFVLCALTMLAFWPVAGANGAVPSLFWTKCLPGSGAGQCVRPRGTVSDPDSGHVYVADSGSNRIDEFTAWGVFVRTWGWDVVASGPDDDTTAPEDEFEVCVPASGDVCKAGVGGGGRGQMTVPQGLALDSGGDLYVADGGEGNRRVQKFDPTAGPLEEEVQFVLMFGGKVNKTKVEAVAPEAQQNLCPVAPTDVCQAATEGTGNGQFGAWVAGGFISVNQSDDTVWVGDQERIQVFEPSGAYLKSVAVPGERVQSLAVDPAGNLYVSYLNLGETNISLAKPNVHKLSPAGASICTAEAHNPTAIATDPAGSVYVMAADSFGELERPTEIRQFSSACVDKAEPFGGGEFTGEVTQGQSPPTGIAIGTGCNVAGVSIYASNSPNPTTGYFVKAYGPRPDPNVCPPPLHPPDVDAQYATSVGSDNATLGAQINPHFWPDTRYYVEYGTAPCTGGTCAQKPLSPGQILAGADVDEALATGGLVLAGLQPNTTYHYRFVSQSSGGGPVYGIDPDGEEGPEEASFAEGLEATFKTTPPPAPLKVDCENQSFRSGASAHLTDCRAYEMVSPVDKNNGDIAVLGRLETPSYPAALEQSAGDGEKLTYTSAIAFGDAVGAPLNSQYVAIRKAGQEWSTHAISPPQESITTENLDLQYKWFSADLCEGMFVYENVLQLAPGAIDGPINAYRRQNCAPGADNYEAVTTGEPTGAALFLPQLQGVSADGAHAFFTATGGVAAGGNPDVKQLYESTRVAPPTEAVEHLVCVLPNGAPSAQNCAAGTLNTFSFDGRDNTVARAVSEDGSRVFWTSFSGLEGPGALYLRENPDQEPTVSGECEESEPEKACTVQISASAARFWTAATNGSKAIYTVGGKLFEYDVEEEAARQIAEGALGVLGASEDASRVYFGSTEALSGDEENSEGDEAKDGEANLYLYEAGEGGGAGSFTFIATLNAGRDVTAEAAGSSLAAITPDPMRRAARVSADGEHLAFPSAASLTGYDNTDAISGKADSEVFLYDAGADELACISCNPSGARPKGRDYEIRNKPFGTWAAAQVPAWENQLFAPRALLDDGSRLFFESFEALVPRDTNGAQDVYEWERATGEEGCKEAGGELYVESAGGCLSLISSGESPTDTEFADASPNGRDVFIKTASSLLPQDPGQVDIYDAREEGGLPIPPPTQPPCEGEACQSPPAAPEDPTPASSDYEGPGNEKGQPGKTRCPKGKRLVRNGAKSRCVAKHKRHHKRAQLRHHRRAAQ